MSRERSATFLRRSGMGEKGESRRASQEAMEATRSRREEQRGLQLMRT